MDRKGISNGMADKVVSLRECADLVLILPHRTHGLRETIERFASSQKLRLNVIIEIDSLTNIKALVARGSGYSILAHAAVVEEIQRATLVIIPIREPVMCRTVFLLRNPARPLTEATREIDGPIKSVI